MRRARFVGVGPFRWEQSRLRLDGRRMPQEAKRLAFHVTSIVDMAVRKEVADALVESLVTQYPNLDVERFRQRCGVKET